MLRAERSRQLGRGGLEVGDVGLGVFYINDACVLYVPCILYDPCVVYDPCVPCVLYK